MKKIIIAAALMLGAFVVSASAQTGGGNRNNKPRAEQTGQREKNREGRGQFERLDLDHDGYLSENEWRKTERGFKRADFNRDARISREEWENYRRERRAGGGN